MRRAGLFIHVDFLFHSPFLRYFLFTLRELESEILCREFFFIFFYDTIFSNIIFIRIMYNIVINSIIFHKKKNVI